MRIKVAYGQEGLWLNLPDGARVTVLEPKFVPGLPDEQAAIREALRRPVGTPPLRELVRPEDTVAIAFSDLTRPMPSDRVLPVLLEELAHVPRENLTLFNAVGTHRPNTPEELINILGREVAESYRIVQHNAFDPAELLFLDQTSFGHEAWVNRAFMAASVKILTGFIEPHLFAGLSGGPKAVLPGLAGERTTLGNHSPRMIENPQATWGITQGNPIWEEMHEVALRIKPTFLLNVTLNKAREITGVFAGDMDQAHAAGVAFVRRSAMTSVLAPFDIVITSNSGYPLDLNLYQAVKGMSAAAQIVRQGGSIILASECKDGIPDHGEYKRLLHMAKSPRQLLDIVTAPGFVCIDQWEAQLQAMIQLKADVYVKSSYLSDEEIRRALLIPAPDVDDTVRNLLRRYGPQATICVLPEGPQTIPYIKESGRI
ncbi:MAG: nickel-dependent lactate racemase [Chloroflexota bacterium]|nr:nickel-dependent lactate racemase [Chloroflexota bacterium]